VELLQGVYLKAVSRTVIVVAEHVDVIEITITTSVAIAVKADAWGAVTRVGSSLESPLVGLHNVELRAIVSADLISIAVVKSIGIPVLAGRIFTRSRNEIESSYASAVALAEVNIIVDSSAKKVGPVYRFAVRGVRS